MYNIQKEIFMNIIIYDQKKIEKKLQKNENDELRFQ